MSLENLFNGSYNLQEELEKAFIAGAEFANDECYSYIDDCILHPTHRDMELAAKQYMNTRALNGSNEPISS